jgi:hypothetical protein
MVILRGIGHYDPYFQCRPDATDALGFTSAIPVFGALLLCGFDPTWATSGCEWTDSYFVSAGHRIRT